MQRPSVEYRQAFDLAVTHIPAGGSPLLAVMSSPVYAVELLKRYPGPVHLVGSGGLNAQEFVTTARDWAWGSLQASPLQEDRGRFDHLVWAEPETETAATTAIRLRYCATTGGHLFVITSGPLRRFLPAWQKKEPGELKELKELSVVPARSPLVAGRVTQRLREAGWVIESRVCFHGPRSVLWSLLSRGAEALGRPDWSDRCLLSMRQVYHEAGWLWPIAPLALIRARAV